MRPDTAWVVQVWRARLAGGEWEYVWKVDSEDDIQQAVKDARFHTRAPLRVVKVETTRTETVVLDVPSPEIGPA